MILAPLRCAQLQEARTILRFAAAKLNRTERCSIQAFLCDMTDAECGAQIGITRGGVHMARQSALCKLRKRLTLLGIHSTADLVSISAQSMREEI